MGANRLNASFTKAIYTIAMEKNGPSRSCYFRVSSRLSPLSQVLLTDDVGLLRDCVNAAREETGFEILAAAVLPTQVSMLWSWPDDRQPVSPAIKMIRSAFARHGSGIWSAGLEVEPVPKANVQATIDLVERAPVLAGLADNPADWTWSSAYRRNVAQVQEARDAG